MIYLSSCKTELGLLYQMLFWWAIYFALNLLLRPDTEEIKMLNTPAKIYINMQNLIYVGFNRPSKPGV